GAALGAGAEQVREHIGEVAGLEALAAGIGIVGAAGKIAVILALRALLPGGVDLAGIIAAALFGVAQQVIGGGGGLEPLGRGGVGVQVRVIGLGDAAIGLLDLGLAGILAQAEGGIRIFCHVVECPHPDGRLRRTARRRAGPA